MTVLSLIARQDYLEKVARTRDPIKANSEFVWNALDADATRISVEFGLNVLGGIEEIVVRDNGIGISRAHAERDFGNLAIPGNARRIERRSFSGRCTARRAGVGYAFSDLHQHADLLAVADYSVVPEYLFGGDGKTAYADWYAGFARNAITFVHTDKSKFSNGTSI